jgi:hypothetical protein
MKSFLCYRTTVLFIGVPFIVACAPPGTAGENQPETLIPSSAAGPSGSWDVRWETVDFVNTGQVTTYRYLDIEESEGGVRAKFGDEKLTVRLDGNLIEFTVTEALQGEGGGRYGQVTLDFMGEITGDTMQGSLTRSDAIISSKQTGRAGDMIAYAKGGAPGFLPETLVQADMVPITFHPRLSMEWSATRRIKRESVDLSGVWMPRPEMSNQWLRDFEEAMTEEAVARRAEWVPYDDAVLRCGSPGLVRVSGWPLPFEVVQHEKVIAIHYEGEGVSRRIYTDGRAMPEDWLESGVGYSVGAWEDGVLTVSTRWLSPALIAERGVEHRGEQTVVTEQMAITNDDRFLRIVMTVEDPLTYDGPLRRVQVWERSDTELLPYECDAYGFFSRLHADGKMEEFFENRPRH